MKFKLIYIPVLLSVVICTFIVGVLDYITADFKWSTILSTAFLTNIASTNLCVVLVLMSTIIVKSDQYKDDPNSDYGIINTEIRSFYTNGYQAPLFKVYSAEKNLQKKKDVYKETINRKLDKLKPKAKDLDIFFNGTEEQKAKNKYCKKVKYYEKLMSDEYIKANIHKIKVKFNTVTPGLVFTGKTSNSLSEDWITKDKAGKAIRDLLPRFLISLVLVLIINLIAPDTTKEITLGVVIKTLSKIVTIISNLSYGLSYSKKYNQEINLHDIQIRMDIINDFKLWQKLQLKQIQGGEVNG